MTLRVHYIHILSLTIGIDYILTVNYIPSIKKDNLMEL